MAFEFTKNKAVRKGVRRLARGRTEKAVDQLAHWPDRLKELYSQVRLLRPVWPEQLQAAQAELKSLAQFLWGGS